MSLASDNQITLAPIERHDDNPIHIWGSAFLMAISVTTGVLLLVSDTPLGVYASIPGVGFIVSGFAVGMHFIGGIAYNIVRWRDERAAQLHVQSIAAIQRRQLHLAAATLTVPSIPKPTIINYANGTQEILEPTPPTLIDAGAAESKAQAVKFLRDSEAHRISTDRTNRICRYDKMGWTPDAWTRARDSLTPLIESNPKGLPKGTYCLAAEYPTIEDLLAGVEAGRVLPSPTGAIILHTASAQNRT